MTLKSEVSEGELGWGHDGEKENIKVESGETGFVQNDELDNL